MDINTKHNVVIGDSRYMPEIETESVHLVVTSPPYWQIKDYGNKNQTGFNDTYEEYISKLNQTWSECYRALQPGCRLCINIGDQFARAITYGRYKIIPIRTEIIKFCESIGFDYMGAVIWQKMTTMHTSGGASVIMRNGERILEGIGILRVKNKTKATPQCSQKNSRAVS